MHWLFIGLFLLIATPSWAAFPQVEATAYSEETLETQTSHDVIIPTGTESGDLLILISAVDGADTVTITGMPSGWVTFADVDNQNACRLVVAYLFATGDPDDFAYTTASGEKSTNHVLRISGAHASTAPEIDTVGSCSENPDPEELNPTGWGTEDTLWIALFVKDRGDFPNLFTSYPTNYDSNQTNDSTDGDTGSNVSFALATDEINTAAEDPGAFAYSGVCRPTVRGTIGVRPAAAVTRVPTGAMIFQ